MKFLVDAQLPPALARWITERGYQCTHVFDLRFHSADDSAIWKHARREQTVIVSKDEDFVDQLLLSEEPVQLVWIRKGNCSNTALLAWFEALWPDVLKRLEQGEQLVELRS